MKIGIDISSVVYGTGVSVYTKTLLTNLLEIDKENEYILLGLSMRRQKELKEFISHLGESNKLKSKVFPIAPSLANILWNRLHILPVESLIGRVDVFHSSDWTQPPAKAFKVTTIHDLSPILFPEYTHPTIVSVHQRRLQWVKKEADRIIVPTNAICEDLIKEGFDKKKVSVIYEGVENIFKSAAKSEIDSLKMKYGIEGDYILGVGVNERKNTKRIIEAFNLLKSYGLKLVIIGHNLMELPKQSNIIYTGHVMDSERPVLYSGASALVYPSLYEGFGLPILEAFACNCPVVTSSLGSMKEVSGGAAILVDPSSAGDIADGMVEAIKKNGELVSKGQNRLKDFSWSTAAKETLRVYEAGRA